MAFNQNLESSLPILTIDGDAMSVSRIAKIFLARHRLPPQEHKKNI